MDVWTLASVPIRVLAMIAMGASVAGSWRLRQFCPEVPGWRRGWTAVMVLSVVLTSRSVLILADPLWPGQQLSPVLRHPLGLALTSLTIATSLVILVTNMRRIFEHMAEDLARRQPPEAGDAD